VHKLVKDLVNMGKHPAILTRGYGRRKGPEVLVLLNGNHRWEETGDEAQLLSSLLPQIPVVISDDRTLAGQTAIDKWGANVLVMDDGFQHWPLRRDLDIVCVDPFEPFGGGLGHLGSFARERSSALRRAGLILVTKANLVGPEHLAQLQNRLASLAKPIPILPGAYRAVVKSSAEGMPPPDLKGQKVLALSGIGSPESFEFLLAGLGALVTPARFRDHHLYTQGEIENIVKKARKENLVVITTMKDAMRVPAPHHFSTLHIELDLGEGEALWRSTLLSVRRP